jgi:hypothetical protein
MGHIWLMGVDGQLSKTLVLKRGTILRVRWGGWKACFYCSEGMVFWGEGVGVGWGRLVRFKLQRVQNHWSDVWHLKARITFVVVIDSYFK